MTSCERAVLGPRDRGDVRGRRRVDVHHLGRFGAGDQLGHVEDRRRVVHGPAGADGDHRDRVRHAVGRQPGAVDRVHGHVAGRAAAVTDLLAVVEHGRAVLLALADHDHAVHGHRVDQQPHSVHGCAVGAVLVATPHPAGRGHGPGLSHPGEFEREVSVRGMPGRRLRRRLLAGRVGAGAAAGWAGPTGSHGRLARPVPVRPAWQRADSRSLGRLPVVVMKSYASGSSA